MTKNAKDSAPIKVTVVSASNSETSIGKPLIGRLSRLGLIILVDDASFCTCEKDFTLERNRQPRKWSHLQLTSETDRIKYRAVNFGEHSAVTLPYRYAVALVDTAKQSAQLYDADLLVTSRIIKSLEASDNVTRDEPKVLTGKEATSEYYKAKALLGESFGTKKTRQMLSSLDRNKIDMEQLATQSTFISRNLDSSISRISEKKDGDAESAVETTSEGGTLVSNDGILPPHSTSTRKVDEIYRMQDLIPQEIYYSLDVSPIVDALNKKDANALTEITTPYNFHEMVGHRLRSLAALTSMPSDADLTHTVRCLVYLNYLMSFRTLNEAKINGNVGHFLSMATFDVTTGLLRQFTEVVTVGNGKQRYKLSSICRDRLVSYICILVLTLDGFRTNTARLSVALQQPATKTADYLRAVGCTVEKPDREEPTKFVVPGTGREIPVKMAVLKAPLTIISSKSRGPPRGRK
ncbi:RNA polymerase I associated factor, A49-like domain-containing protein [Paramicrosporidium saccamoebae]|uniref:RNA polymerase I associated factor, A49-like domain-containing protein n=1 Tax=Paramicrosporidium saccamoebae TaxID=1246581 RepID=A0A2H9TI87_9FUNG|nr:RNA polymerase I associated factor, A49-like domain-containing protein [Paramicrosporidium saccamoebae]